MTQPWIQTRDGHAVDLLDPDLSSVTIEEIAHSLARINRYTGHTRGRLPYSVAQHSVYVSWHVPAEHEFAALMHDAHEAIIGDISTPVKEAIAALCMQTPGAAVYDPLRALDRIVRAATRKKFGLEPELPACVKHADLEALVTERRDLLGGVQARPWNVDDTEYRPWGLHIEPWPVGIAEENFLYTFRKLSRLRALACAPAPEAA